MDDLDAICDKVINYYRENAEKRFEDFERSLADHCRYCLKFMSPAPGRVLDIGSGSGRDAALFASEGYDVVAVEPAHELRQLAEQKYRHPDITWLDDRLPDLKTLSSSQNHFDHLHLSAVIFHLPLGETRAILETVHRLLKPDGTLFIGLRIGPSDPLRPMYNIDQAWVSLHSTGLFTLVDFEHSKDDLKRSDVEWCRLILKKA